MITPNEALITVKNYVKNQNLINHMIAVSAIMGKIAEKLGVDIQLWKVVGMLHDIDYELTFNDFKKHGLISAEIVDKLLPEEGLHAIMAHNELTGVKAENVIDIGLFAADALSGMITAGALVRPTKLEGMKTKSIIKRMKDKSFARAVNRENIYRSEEIGIQLNDFITLGLEAMQEVAIEIGLK